MAEWWKQLRYQHWNKVWNLTLKRKKIIKIRQTFSLTRRKHVFWIKSKSWRITGPRETKLTALSFNFFELLSYLMAKFWFAWTNHFESSSKKLKCQNKNFCMINKRLFEISNERQKIWNVSKSMTNDFRWFSTFCVHNIQTQSLQLVGIFLLFYI